VNTVSTGPLWVRLFSYLFAGALLATLSGLQGRLDYVIDQTQRLITIVGMAGAEDWTFLLSRLFHDPRRPDDFVILRDLRQCQSLTRETAAAVVETATRYAPLAQPTRVALLIDQPAEAAALTALIPFPATNWLRAFTAYQAAREWLRVGLTD
jgi:hypothetical protein